MIGFINRAAKDSSFEPVFFTTCALRTRVTQAQASRTQVFVSGACACTCAYVK